MKIKTPDNKRPKNGLEIKTTREIKAEYLIFTAGFVKVIEGDKRWVAVDDVMRILKDTKKYKSDAERIIALAESLSTSDNSRKTQSACEFCGTVEDIEYVDGYGDCCPICKENNAD